MASPRERAASIATARFSLTFACPINSPSRCGRSFSSNEESSSTAAADTTRSGLYSRLGLFLAVATRRMLPRTPPGRICRPRALRTELHPPLTCRPVRLAGSQAGPNQASEPKRKIFEAFRQNLKETNIMKIKSGVIAVFLLAVGGGAFGQQGPVPKGVPALDHVFLIMMENHGYSQILHNPNAPYINRYAQQANLATNYFAVAHPSLTNYLEVVGGSNFGVLSDNSPDWHNPSCTTNLASGIPNADTPPSPAICPVSGSGTDA